MENLTLTKENLERDDLEILRDYTQQTDWLNKKNLIDLTKMNIKNNISDSKTAKKVTEAYGFRRIKLGGIQFDIINGSSPLAPKEHLIEITENRESRVIEFNSTFSFEEAVRKIYGISSKQTNVLLNKYENYKQKQEKGSVKYFSEKAAKSASCFFLLLRTRLKLIT